MHGLGDNIYQRAVVRRIPAPLWLETSWPELYSDLPVHFVRASTNLRTQKRNLMRQPAGRWEAAPHNARTLSNRYAGDDIRAGRSIISCMERALGLEPAPGPMVFDLPDTGLPPPVPGKRYVVVRPATVRDEWRADARNPHPEYLAWVCLQLQARGYTIVSVADLEDHKEWLVGQPPAADVVWHKGELPIQQLLALVRGATACVGGVGWLVPACMAAQVPMFCIYGGWGAYNAPHVICDPRLPTRWVYHALPDNFCTCADRFHKCDKDIAGLAEHFEAWIADAGI
jgi:hypothetical protein